MTMRAAVAATLVAALIASPAARAADFVGFDHVTGIDANGVFHTATIPYTGLDKRPLLGADFYRAVGREDLAQSYETRQKIKGGLIAGGIAVMVLSAIAGFASGGGHQECLAAQFGQPLCTQVNDPPNIAVVAGGSAAGFALAVAGIAVPSDPVDEAQKQLLADQHNQALKPHASLVPDGEGLALKVAF